MLPALGPLCWHRKPVLLSDGTPNWFSHAHASARPAVHTCVVLLSPEGPPCSSAPLKYLKSLPDH